MCPITFVHQHTYHLIPINLLYIWLFNFEHFKTGAVVNMFGHMLIEMNGHSSINETTPIKNLLINVKFVLNSESNLIIMSWWVWRKHLLLIYYCCLFILVSNLTDSYLFYLHKIITIIVLRHKSQYLTL